MSPPANRATMASPGQTLALKAQLRSLEKEHTSVIRGILLDVRPVWKP